MKTSKLYKNIFAIVLSLGMLFSGCEQLDLGPIDYYGNENYWKTYEQVNAYMNGIHLDLRSTNFNRKFIMGEARGGLHVAGTTSQNVSTSYDNIKNNNLDGNNTGLSAWGGSLYGNIFDCNLLIQNVEGSDIHTANKKNIDIILGQAYAIRAMYYFTLYRTYGGVPVVTRVKVLDGKVSAEDLYTGRSTPKDVMDFIKSDIAKAFEYFGTYQDAGNLDNKYWNVVTTRMLAADVYLWSSKVTLGNQTPASDDLSKAESYLNLVKNDARFQLIDDFESIFASNNENNKEVIFAINYADGEATSNVGDFLYAPANMFGNFYTRDGVLIEGDILELKGIGLQRNEYTKEFWHSFNNKDSRREATFFDYYDKDGALAGTVMKKFIGQLNSTQNRVFDSNEPVYRYSNVLLMLAEIENMKGGNPAQYINQIRKRAYGKNYNDQTDAYANSDFKTNEITILQERDKEFVYEGARWYDVLRLKDGLNGRPLVFDNVSTYKGEPVLDYATEKHEILWPVDAGTINADPLLKQTPGYAVAGQEEEKW